MRTDPDNQNVLNERSFVKHEGKYPVTVWTLFIRVVDEGQ